MEQKNQPMSSLIPVLLFGLGSVLFLQLFMGEQEESRERLPESVDPVSDASLKDFEFSGGVEESELIDAGYYYALLSSRGARIERLYMRSHDNVTIPDAVIDESPDPRSQELQALEVTRRNGFDFQPHLYYRGSRSEQLGNPLLNEALFSMEGPEVNEEAGVTELRFRKPITFDGHRLELVKVYRFLKNENFFRQITIIRNLENRPFELGGDLFFRTGGDIGPAPEGEQSRTMANFGRFYRYDDSLEQNLSVAGGGGGGLLGCGGCGGGPTGEYTIHSEAPNSLEFMGSFSRYLFSYSKFLYTENPLHRPDGIINRNTIDPEGKRAFTAFFSNFRLSPADGEPIDTGTLDLIDDEGNYVSSADGNRGRIRRAQNRTDALIIDNMVYVGVRTEESHRLQNNGLALAEFGTDQSDESARDVIYRSGFLAIFSKIRDFIVWLMRIVYTFTGNYGWAIIIIAGGFKLLTFPLNQMQAKSMKRMTALKPELEKINEKYKEEPQEKQKKTMELYKKHNVNPMKGCLPILIQLPIFIAFFSAFTESIELWRSPFILWITDLSSPDTIYTIRNLGFIESFNINILPLLMISSQIVQQKLTTMVMDPQQKMIMYMMPVIMIFFFWGMPSGVTLYWTVQNVIAIVWQIVNNKLDTGDGPAKA